MSLPPNERLSQNLTRKTTDLVRGTVELLTGNKTTKQVNVLDAIDLVVGEFIKWEKTFPKKLFDLLDTFRDIRKKYKHTALTLFEFPQLFETNLFAKLSSISDIDKEDLCYMHFLQYDAKKIVFVLQLLQNSHPSTVRISS